MSQEETQHLKGLNLLFNKNFPHILEKIFFNLDSKSFVLCRQVCKAWDKLLTTESYKLKLSDISEDEINLLEAASVGNIEDIKGLLSAGVDPNCETDSLGVYVHGHAIPEGPPLYYAAQFGHIDAIKVLLEAGADPNIEDEDGKTPLHVTITCPITHKFWPYTPSLPMVKLLLDAGADTNRVDNKGHTPLYWATINNKGDEVKLLLAKGADPNQANEDGETPLQKAMNMGVEELVKILLEAGANQN